MINSKISLFAITVSIITLVSCSKNATNSHKIENTISQNLQSIIQNDSIYKRLVISYDPSYINYRVEKKNEKFNVFNYTDEYNSLSNLRLYYYYLLQKKYTTSLPQILNLIKKNNSVFFDKKIKPANDSFESLANITSRNYIEISCPIGLVFNPVILLCDFPENVDGGDFYFCYDTDTYEVFDCLAGSVSHIDDSYADSECRIDNNPYLTVLEFADKCCLPSLWDKFPLGQTGSYAALSLSYVKANRETTAIFKRCWFELTKFSNRK